jgi:ketosteroid isomerase-like protein
MLKLPFAAPLAAVAALTLASAAYAADPTPAEIVQRHTAAGGDLDKLMQDYADNAVVFQQGRAIQGKAAIRALYAKMFPQRPAGAQAPAKAQGQAPAARPAGGGMKVTKVWEDGDVGFMTWEAGPVKATEQFLVRDGKIVLQAIFMSGAPTSAASG